MKRKVSSLADREFDLLVIGGGIYGSWIALRAARRGLSVALIDKGDWGSGTSSGSSKLLHGGLRYLEHYKFGLVRKSLQERRMLNQLMPHQVRPQRFLLPVYRGGPVPRWQLGAGLWLYDRLAGSRQPVDRHHSMSRQKLQQEAPFLSADGLTGGFDYGDCGTDDARMVVEIVDSAMQASACAVNYVRAMRLLRDKHGVQGANVQDVLTGESFDLRARVTVNAAGSWAPPLMGKDRKRNMVRLTKGVHVVLPPLPCDKAFLLNAKQDGRVFFLIPWYGRTLLGTTDTDYTRNPDDVAVNLQDVDYLLQAAVDYVGRDFATEDRVRGTFCGIRTLRNEVGKTASEVTREWSLEEPEEGLLMPIGGKYTSARVEAGEVVDRAQVLLGGRAQPDPEDPLAWFGGDTWERWSLGQKQAGVEVGLKPDVAESCARRYGARATEVHDLVRGNWDLAENVVEDLPFCYAECVVAAKSEMACTLLDVLRRRVPLTILEPLPKETVTKIAGLVGSVLGWDEKRIEEEASSVIASQRIPNGD